jgi:hypothetical protein
MSLLAAHGFTIGMLVYLVRDGLVDVQTETITAPGSTVEVVRVRIAAAGQGAIESE